MYISIYIYTSEREKANSQEAKTNRSAFSLIIHELSMPRTPRTLVIIHPDMYTCIYENPPEQIVQGIWFV